MKVWSMETETKNPANNAIESNNLVGCQCTLAQSLCGDGCQFCNPELGAELKWDSEADEWNKWGSLGKDERDELIKKFKESNATDDSRKTTGDERWDGN